LLFFLKMFWEDITEHNNSIHLFFSKFKWFLLFRLFDAFIERFFSFWNLSWDEYLEGNNELSVSFFTNNWHSFTGELDFFTMLCTRCYSDFSFSEKWEANFFVDSEHCFCWAHFYGTVEIITSSNQIILWLFDMANYIEIPITMLSCMPLIVHPNSHTVIYTSGYLYYLWDFFLDMAFPVTFRTRMLDDTSFSMTISTSDCLLHHTKDASSCLWDITRSSALGTGFWFFSVFCTMSMADFTICHAIKGDFFFYSGKAFSKRNFYIVLYILSAFISSGLLLTSKSPHISKNGWENILDIDISKIKSSHTTKSTSTICRAKLVVTSFFAGIWEDGIRLINCFKFLFFPSIAIVSIWVVIHRFFTIGFFYLISRSISLDSEDGIIVFTHRKGLYDFLVFGKSVYRFVLILLVAKVSKTI